MAHRIVNIDVAPTRFLMKVKSYPEVCPVCLDFACSIHEDYRSKEQFYDYGSDHDGTRVGFMATRAQIFAELNKREHVENKKEGHVERRRLSKTNHGLSKSKDK